MCFYKESIYINIYTKEKTPHPIKDCKIRKDSASKRKEFLRLLSCPPSTNIRQCPQIRVKNAQISTIDGRIV